MTVLDPKNKTKTLTNADLEGEVVMIDFWATWCGPCLRELPEIQKLVESFQEEEGRGRHCPEPGQQAQGPGQRPQVRRVDPGKEGHRPDGDSVGRVGLDTANTVGKPFHLEGYATVDLIDAEGLVRKVHVGFNKEIGKTLHEDIDALLQGKVLGKKTKAEK